MVNIVGTKFCPGLALWKSGNPRITSQGKITLIVEYILQIAHL